MTLEELLRQGKSFGQGASNAAASTVTGPVDMLAWLLRKGGVNVGEAPIGGEAWMRQKGLMATPENRLAGLLGEGAGLAAPIVAAAKAPEIAGGLLQMGRNLATPQTLNKQTGAIVWHGSPHKFDKFDASKIGTGEGAQAYGHGLYLAESPSVAKSYADTLSQYHIGTRDGMKSGGDFADALVANAGDYPASLSSAIRSQANKVATDLAGGKTAEQVIASMRNGPYARMYAGLADAVEKMSPTKAGGSLYKVDLPDDAIAKMLDWDAPLSKQPANIQSWLKDAYNPYRKQLTALDVGGNEPTGGLVMNRLQQLMSEGKKADVFTNAANYGAANASREIADYGIPGIRYLDGGSRSAGAGSSNFVVFPGNEGLLKILERNGGKP